MWSESTLLRREASGYRYFLGFRPRGVIRRTFIGNRNSLVLKTPVRDEHLHMTLCVIAELLQRDETIAGKVGSALHGHDLEMCRIMLGRVTVIPNIAMLKTRGCRSGIMLFQQALVQTLLSRGVSVLPRANFNPHVTLGRRVTGKYSIEIEPIEWWPDEILLIESHQGLTRHDVLGRWPLLPPAQRDFLAPDFISAVGNQPSAFRSSAAPDTAGLSARR